jgi:hypothetical protein
MTSSLGPRWIGHQAQVHHVAQNVFINLVGAAVFDVDIDGGKKLEEFFQIRRQIVQADAVNRGHADGAGNDVLDFLEAVLERVIGLDDLLAVFVKHLAFAGEAELFLLRSISRDLNWRSRELICWLTADWVTLLIWAALVKLSVSARSQKTLKLSICIPSLNAKNRIMSTYVPNKLDKRDYKVLLLRQHLFDFAQQVLGGERLLQISLLLLRVGRTDVPAGPNNARVRRGAQDVLAQFPAAHVRHDQVGDDQIDLLFGMGEQFQAFCPLLAVMTV